VPIISSLAGASSRGFGSFKNLISASSVASFDSIATTTLSSPQSTLVVGSIPGTYQHLQIRGILKSTAIPGGTPRLYFNNDRTTNSYSMHEIFGNGGGSTGVNQQFNLDAIYASLGSQNTTQFGAYVINIFDYASTSKSKTIQFIHGFDSNASGYVSFSTGMYTSTNAITSFGITPQQTANFDTGSTMAVYGIKA